jgi:hypothetical protein
MQAKISDYGVLRFVTALGASGDSGAVAKPARRDSLVAEGFGFWDDDDSSSQSTAGDGAGFDVKALVALVEAEGQSADGRRYHAMVAPEVWASGDSGAEPVGLAVDVYSYAILCFEITSQREAWDDLKGNLASIREQVLRGARPRVSRSCPESAEKTIARCWAQKPAERPSFAEIVEGLL